MKFRMHAVAMLALAVFTSVAGAAPLQVGVGVHVGQNKNDLDATAAALEQARVTSFRDEVFWHRLERRKGVLEFPESLNDLDQLVTRAAQRGLRPLLILDYGNPLYDGGGQLSSAEGIAAWSRYVHFVVKHFKGRVDQFEVWNEWNIGSGGTPAQRAARHGSPEDYAKVLQAAYTAVKAENSAATVIGGAFAGYDYKWIEAFARAGGFGSLDGFSTHPYVFAEGKAKGTPESAIRHLDELKALIGKLAPGRDVRIYVTEAGWPVYSGVNGVTEQQSASYLRQFMLLAKARPWIAGVWWYDLFDDGDDAANTEHRFGLIDHAGAKRPAFQALAKVRDEVVAP